MGDINVLHSKFRKGWAIPRDESQTRRMHYFVRCEAAAAVSVCAHDIRTWAGQLYEPRRGVQVCVACWDIIKRSE